MSKVKSYIWFVIVVIYLLVPWDLHPSLLDDLLVFGLYLMYVFRQMNKLKNVQHAHRRAKSQDRTQTRNSESFEDAEEPLNLQNAYRILRVTPAASREEIRKAFRERVSENHPDKVSHLSQELKKRANELTSRINRAYNLVKKHKNM
jgi:Ca2+/Na+ antiporter